MPSNKLAPIRRSLLHWYDTAHRDMPWRRTRDPYAIWIAETMLQQTQVTTVVPYYDKFLNAFPTARALDRAPLCKVLALWSGLGYYRRAENLKKSARQIVAQHRGRLPADYKTLLSLPGVGAYTAGAVMSIAFGARYPALDGNARRVLGRMFNIDGEKELRERAARLVPKLRPGYFNQGLMELGATICLPRIPKCHACPVAGFCAARRAGQLSSRVAPGASRNVTGVFWPMAIVRSRGKVLLRRRPNDGILRGLWEFPGGEKRWHEDLQAMLRRHLAEFNAALQCHGRIAQIRHSITNKRILSPIVLFDVRRPGPIALPGSRWRWVSLSSLRRLPVSSMTLKAASVLAGYEKNLS
ncbi:MAG TPA: A/G-specific adenine glycosylase [Candidatus Binatia bacterium]|nr:A/G-specific adenine glycosylase [Candidatus Binatia bacterium]